MECGGLWNLRKQIVLTRCACEESSPFLASISHRWMRLELKHESMMR